MGRDGCLYATQSDEIIKVTNADGSCSLVPTSGAPQLSLSSPNSAPALPGPVGWSVTFDATFRNSSGPAGDVPVTWTVTGANSQTSTTSSDATGTAAVTYTGSNPGTDTVTASARLGGTPVVSNPQTVTFGPGPVGSLTGKLSGQSSITLSWTAPTVTAGGIDHYGIHGGPGGDLTAPASACTATGCTATVTGLTAYTSYPFTVYERVRGARSAPAGHRAAAAGHHPANVHVPAPSTAVTVTATSTSPVSVTYTVSASDNSGVAPTVSCTPREYVGPRQCDAGQIKACRGQALHQTTTRA